MTDELIEIERARELILERVTALPSERIPFDHGMGRVLAAGAFSQEPVPGFDNSAMDGYAVRAADTFGAGGRHPIRLEIVGESRAGHPCEVALEEDQAIQISTGAAIPAGANAVVRVEDTDRQDDRTVLVRAEVQPGDEIRRAGEDFEAGVEILSPGSRIGPVELGLLASLGFESIVCHRRPRLHLLTSGDELVEPGEPMRPGGVRNTNRYTITALAERAGAEVTSSKAIPDRPEATRAAIEEALAADIVVICGGVSVGEHDHVKAALAELSVEEVFWRVALKPGKPTWFGMHGETPVFGLPGNPVSAMVTFLLLVRPALAEMTGFGAGRYRAIALMARDFHKKPGRTHAVPSVMSPDKDGWRVWPIAKQGSHMLTSIRGAHGLAMLPTDETFFAKDTPVEVEVVDLSDPLEEPF